MKITIELTPAEVQAIKAYLKEVSHDVNPVITREDIKAEIVGMVSSEMQAGAMGDYYNKFVNK